MTDSSLTWSPVPARQLNLSATLRSAQAFRWHCTAEGEWHGTVASTLVRLVPQRHGFWWSTFPNPNRFDLLEEYFALDVDLNALYRRWTATEPRIESALENWRGLRILRQEPGEVLFSFICACCNSITKISRSVSALGAAAGDRIGTLNGRTYYRFPTPDQIASVPEDQLRADLWGYRAPRLIATAKLAAERGPEWIVEMQQRGYNHAHAELVDIHGIGAKLADCICLFGMGHNEAVPVDTHVRQIGVRLFNPELANRSLTPRVYNAIALAFRATFGPYAGWAQQYLFLDELRIEPAVAAARTPRTARRQNATV